MHNITKKVALFTELVNQIGWHRLRLRLMKFVQEQFSWRQQRKTSNG